MQLKKLWIVPLMLVLIFSLSLVSVGKERVVPTDYSTIQAAVEAAVSGDTVVIQEGTYKEHVEIRGKQDLTITSAGDRDKTFIDGSFLIISTLTPVKNITISGLSIRNTGYGTTRGHAIAVRGMVEGLTIKNNAIFGCEKNGIDFSVPTTYSDVMIKNNEIYNNGYDGINLSDDGTNITINNNLIRNNGAVSATGVGVRIASSVTDVLIKKNVITGNAFANIHPG